MAAGGTLNAGQTLKSPNGQSKLVLQADGNLVVRVPFLPSPCTDCYEAMRCFGVAFFGVRNCILAVHSVKQMCVASGFFLRGKEWHKRAIASLNQTCSKEAICRIPSVPLADMNARIQMVNKSWYYHSPVICNPATELLLQRLDERSLCRESPLEMCN